MTGTGLAQAIGIGVSPILSRLYGPDDFGVLAIYLAIVSVLGLFATGRYEMSIMLPEDENEVPKIVALIFGVTLIVCGLTLFAVYLFNPHIARALGNASIGPWLYFLPFSIFINSCYQVANYLLIRNSDFKQVAANRLIYSSSNSLLQVGLGALKFGGIGMLYSSLIGYIVAIVAVVNNRLVRKAMRGISLKGLKPIARRYRKFPLFDLPSASINLLSNQLPIFALGKFFTIMHVGFYSFTFRVLSAPLNLVSNSVLDVFKQRATEDFQKYGDCKRIFINTFKSLMIVSIVPFMILFIWGQPLFGFVFGEKWAEAGQYAQILAPMLMLKFISSPLTYVFYIAEKQHYDLGGQILLLLLLLMAIVIGIYSNDVMHLLKFYASSYSIVYLIYLYASFRLSEGKSS